MIRVERVEEKAIVLDYLPKGKASDVHSFKKEPLAQVIGTSYFTLLEVVPKKAVNEETKTEQYVNLKIHDEVYIGKGEREKIHFIKGRIAYEDLTPVAESELKSIVEELTDAQEARFVGFFNNAQPITIRMHQLELLPKVGKKLMKEILAERKKAPFTDFTDIENRIKNVPRPREIIVDRIMEEIRAESKYYIFTANPPKPKEDEERGYRRFNRYHHRS